MNAEAQTVAGEHPDFHVIFRWHRVGDVSMDTGTGAISVPDRLNKPGVYLLEGGRHDGDMLDDAWYVGRSTVSMKFRVRERPRTEFDEETQRGKRFYALPRLEDGWVRVYEARDITISNHSGLRLPAGMTTQDVVVAEAPDVDAHEARVQELVLNLVEAAGIASCLIHMGTTNRR